MGYLGIIGSGGWDASLVRAVLEKCRVDLSHLYSPPCCHPVHAPSTGTSAVAHDMVSRKHHQRHSVPCQEHARDDS